jgi:hypothetical protein
MHNKLLVRTLATILTTIGIVIISTASARPAAADTAFSVSSTHGWQNTGVNLKVNQIFRITYNYGIWTVGRHSLNYVGPDGYTPDVDRNIYGPCKEWQGHPFGYLAGTIFNAARPDYPLHVGQGGTWTVPVDGSLWLRINDRDACLGDNAGAITVTVSVLR